MATTAVLEGETENKVKELQKSFKAKPTIKGVVEEAIDDFYEEMMDDG